MHSLLKEHGTFEAVECHVQKWQEEQQKDQLAGGWHTEISLAALGWDTCHVCTRRNMHCRCVCVYGLWWLEVIMSM